MRGKRNASGQRVDDPRSSTHCTPLLLIGMAGIVALTVGFLDITVTLLMRPQDFVTAGASLHLAAATLTGFAVFIALWLCF